MGSKSPKKHSKDVTNLSRKRLIKGIEKLRLLGATMTPLQMEQFYISEILAPACEQLEVLYGPRMEELAAVKEQLTGIHQMLLSILQNSAKLHYQKIYKPKIEARQVENQEEEAQLQLCNCEDFLSSPPLVQQVVAAQPAANKNSTTKLCGVRMSKGKYVAHIWHEPLRRKGKKSAQQNLGSYADPIFAALVRDAAAADLLGEKAKLNYPIQETD